MVWWNDDDNNDADFLPGGQDEDDEDFAPGNDYDGTTNVSDSGEDVITNQEQHERQQRRERRAARRATKKRRASKKAAARASKKAAARASKKQREIDQYAEEVNEHRQKVQYQNSERDARAERRRSRKKERLQKQIKLVKRVKKTYANKKPLLQQDDSGQHSAIAHQLPTEPSANIPDTITDVTMSALARVFSHVLNTTQARGEITETEKLAIANEADREFESIQDKLLQAQEDMQPDKHFEKETELLLQLNEANETMDLMAQEIEKLQIRNPSKVMQGYAKQHLSGIIDGYNKCKRKKAQYETCLVKERALNELERPATTPMQYARSIHGMEERADKLYNAYLERASEVIGPEVGDRLRHEYVNRRRNNVEKFLGQRNI